MRPASARSNADCLALRPALPRSQVEMSVSLMPAPLRIARRPYIASLQAALLSCRPGAHYYSSRARRTACGACRTCPAAPRTWPSAPPPPAPTTPRRATPRPRRWLASCPSHRARGFHRHQGRGAPARLLELQVWGGSPSRPVNCALDEPLWPSGGSTAGAALPPPATEANSPARATRASSGTGRAAAGALCLSHVGPVSWPFNCKSVETNGKDVTFHSRVRFRATTRFAAGQVGRANKRQGRDI